LCDRIKETLTDTCLKHILTIESSEERGWLLSSKLCETIDLYFANNLEATKTRFTPVSAAVGNVGNNNYSGRNNPTQVHTNFCPLMKSPSTQSSSHLTPSVGIKNSGGRRCHSCQSEYHLQNTCPQRNNGNMSNQNVRTGNFGRGGARINACSLSAVSVPFVPTQIENLTGCPQRNESSVVSTAPADQTETGKNDSDRENDIGNSPALLLEPNQPACPSDLPALNSPYLLLLKFEI